MASFVCACGNSIPVEEVVTVVNRPPRVDPVTRAVKAQSVVLWPSMVICGSCGMEMKEVEDA